MGWKFWEREQTDAERSLAALQAGTPPAPAPAPPAPVDPEAAALEELTARADAHMSEVTQRLEDLLASTPTEERGEYMLEVTAVSAGADGTVEVTGGATSGTVAPGAVVGLMLLPPEAAQSWSEDAGPFAHDDVPAMRRHLEILLRTTAASATVVAWRPDVPALVLSGVDPTAINVGSMVTR
ncbi:MAG: hypothetical protein JWN84_2880 [Nocardioides sp.]|jgi:hypothetical protein|nr:hypothetical protein [Nocardioides sp.]